MLRAHAAGGTGSRHARRCEPHERLAPSANMLMGAGGDVAIRLELSAVVADAGDMLNGKPTLICQHGACFDTPHHGFANAGFSPRRDDLSDRKRRWL